MKIVLTLFGLESGKTNKVTVRVQWETVTIQVGYSEDTLGIH